MPQRELLPRTERRFFATVHFLVAPTTVELVDRSDPVTLLIAKKIIGLTRRGERDPSRLRQAAVQVFSDAPERPETRAPTLST
jgi:hypothetical protein